MKRYTSAELARGFLTLREKTSHTKATQALAAALISGKISHRLESVVHEIHRELLRQGTAVAQITSAHELTGELKRELTHLVKKLTAASHVEATYHLNPDLIGGFIAITPTHTIDASVASFLNHVYV